MGKGMTVTKMKTEIQRMVKDLGMSPMKFNADKSLSGYHRGKPLTVGELRALPKGSPVWVYYKEHGESGPRINGPMWATTCKDAGLAGDENTWALDDGSSFAAEFSPTGAYDPEAGAFNTALDTDECFDEGGGEGCMRLYHVLPRKLGPDERTKSNATPRRRR